MALEMLRHPARSCRLLQARSESHRPMVKNRPDRREMLRRQAVVVEIHRTLRRAGFVGCLVVLELLITVQAIIGSTGRTELAFDRDTFWFVFRAVADLRKEWPEEILLAVPIAVLLPAFLTVLLSTPPGFGGALRARREQAHFELLQWVLGGGLVLAALLSGLLILPYEGVDYVPIALLSAGVTIACCLLSQMLLGAPTRRAMQLTAARAKARAWSDARDRAESSIKQAAGEARGFLGNWRSGFLLAVVVLLFTSLPSVVIVAGLMWTGGVRDVLSMLAVLAPSGLTSGFTGYLVADGVSCLRVAPTWSERADALSSFVLPLTMAGILIRMSMQGIGSQQWWGLIAIALSVSALPTALGYCLSRTLLGSCLEYRFIRRQVVLADAKVVELEAHQARPSPRTKLSTPLRSKTVGCSNRQWTTRRARMNDRRR